MKRFPEIVEVDLSAANTQYTVTIEAGVKSYTIKTRGNTSFKLAYKTGQVENDTGDFITMPAGIGKTEDGLTHENPFTLYVSCEKANEILEVEKWR